MSSRPDGSTLACIESRRRRPPAYADAEPHCDDFTGPNRAGRVSRTSCEYAMSAASTRTRGRAVIGDTTEGFDDALGDALPTVAEVVAMPTTQLGRPKVLAGEVSLGRRVRWLHVSELKDIASLLHG